MSNNNNGNYGMIDPITNAIGMAYNIGTGIFNSVQNYRNNQWNQRFAREQFDYQKELNQTLMNREDNAVQRRAKDLQAAGISKNLAAGSPAQAATMSAGNSGAVANSNMQTQQLQKMDIMNGYAQYQMVMAEKELKNVQAIVEAKREGLIDEQIATERINQIVGEAQARNLDANTKLTNTKNNRENHDYNIDKRRGAKSNETISQKNVDIRDAISTVGEVAGKVTESVLSNNPKKVDKELDNLLIDMYLNETGSFKKILNKYYDLIPGENEKEKLKYVKRVCNNIRWNY